MNIGKFITLEGGGGAGKTTQSILLRDILAKNGINAILTREPGGTPQAEKIRSILVNRNTEWDPMTEALLHMAARSEHITRVISPQLKAGNWIICDRFADSTIAYQGYAQGLGMEHARRLHECAFANLLPDLTIVFDIDPVQALERTMEHKGATFYDNQSLVFHQLIRQGFQKIAQQEPERVKLIDGGMNKEIITKTCIDLIKKQFAININ